MPTVIAIFDDMARLQRAQDALDKAGYGDDVERVVDRSDESAAGAGAEVARELAAGTAFSRAGRTHPLTENATLSHLGLTEEEERFVEETLQDGARLLVLRTKHPAEVMDLVRPFAQEVIRSK
ncbi:MAG TPA: hypothetical protein VF171_01780 [Trueperaceae bacterium]